MVETPTIPAPASEGGGAAAPAQVPVTTEPTLVGGIGSESTAGGETTPGSDTTAGKTEGGNDSVAGAPDKYEFKLPDGFQANSEQIGKFEEFARAANLPQERAQELLDMHIGALTATSEAYAKTQLDGWKSTLDGWRTEVTNDPEFSGEKLAAAQVTIGKALDQFGAKGVREAFQLTGAGDNPAIFRTFYAMAKALSEGGARPPGTPGKAKPGTPAEVFYASPTS